MKLYSDIPARRTRQLIGDLGLVSVVDSVDLDRRAPAWTRDESGCAGAGHGRWSDEPGREHRLGRGVGVSGVPLVGDSLATPFQGMGDAARAIASAGAAEVDAVSKLALFLSVALAFLAIASFAIFWVPWRIAFIRRATAARELRPRQ